MNNQTLMDKLVLLDGYLRQFSDASFMDKTRIAEQVMALNSSIMAAIVLKIDAQGMAINTLEALQDGVNL